jgi:hypothetical protein
LELTCVAGPAFYFNANPDPVPNFHFDADPDPAPREIYTYPLGSSGFQTLYGSNVSSQGRALMAPFLAPEFCFFYADPDPALNFAMDPDPDFHSDADPACQRSSDPDLQHWY